MKKFLILFGLMIYSLNVSPQTHPGSMTYSNNLKEQLATAVKNKGDDYKPRTRFLRDGQALYTNRLILEDSPYLLQHAHNPVNWHPWGKEAFAQANKEQKPIFLSIGYATCHWCHVMEEESFENEAIATLLNQHFISIKVDREQYPDVDEAYMTAVMIMNGSGGWPMSSFLLADGKPFFGGTYFPPAQFKELLTNISQLWRNKNDQIVQQAEQLAASVSRLNNTKKAEQTLGTEAVDKAREDIFSRYEPMDGGFSQAPKFPHEPSLLLLLQTADQSSQEQAEALEHSLSAMAQGGIYDQIGGGFHRYSTDAQWLAPHFEKMLYNQAYLSRIYAEAWRQNDNPLHARIARQTIDYVLREMTHEQGGFYSATDADSEGEEGTYFLWDQAEIRELLSSSDAQFIEALYGVSEKGNFEGRNIFHLSQSLAATAQQLHISLSDLIKRLDKINAILYQHRNQRIAPLTDDKIIVAWNGMMITALVEVGTLFNEPHYIQAAIKAAEMIWQKQVSPGSANTSLWRVNLNGQPSIEARQDDYAHYAEALLALYDQSADPIWLTRAVQISDQMIETFFDPSSGIFLMGNDPLLFTQASSSHDGATPSGNSVAVRVLSRLARRSGEHKYDDLASSVLASLSTAISEYPASYAYLLAQLDERLNGEISALQYAARSAIRIEGEIQPQTNKPDQLLVNINIDQGWHINANKPAHEDLIATQIHLHKNSTTVKLDQVNYPAATMKALEFEEEPLALYQGQIQIRADLVDNDNNKKDKPLVVEVQIQACNQQVCLAPETLSLSLKRKPLSLTD